MQLILRIKENIRLILFLAETIDTQNKEKHTIDIVSRRDKDKTEKAAIDMQNTEKDTIDLRMVCRHL
jgi:hypothetical protein